MESKIITEQKDWIRSGKIGCVFASALVKHADKIGWKFYLAQEIHTKGNKIDIPKDCFIASIVFPKSYTIFEVKAWANTMGFYIEQVEELYEGLRIKVGTSISWVQYFGNDSHVKTRQSPYPMLTFGVKVPPQFYWKVGFNGIIHVAHASVKFLTSKKQDTLWNQSIAKTKKELGHSPTIREAAKVTFLR